MPRLLAEEGDGRLGPWRDPKHLAAQARHAARQVDGDDARACRIEPGDRLGVDAVQRAAPARRRTAHRRQASPLRARSRRAGAAARVHSVGSDGGIGVRPRRLGTPQRDVDAGAAQFLGDHIAVAAIVAGTGQHRDAWHVGVAFQDHRSYGLPGTPHQADAIDEAGRDRQAIGLCHFIGREDLESQGLHSMKTTRTLIARGSEPCKVCGRPIGRPARQERMST